MKEKKALLVMKIRTYKNVELATIALNALEELIRRGNEELDGARQRVAFFHSDILCLQSMASAIGHGLDYEDD